MYKSKATKELEHIFTALEDYVDRLKFYQSETNDVEELNYFKNTLIEAEPILAKYDKLLEQAYKKDENNQKGDDTNEIL